MGGMRKIGNGEEGIANRKRRNSTIRYSPLAIRAIHTNAFQRHSPLRILVTNDDGIHAEGLDVCEKIARMLSDDVWVIAPEYDQSGVAHSLSLNDPLRLRQVEERRFAVRGTPTDCVIMGARHLLNGHDPDLVLSGVNRGRNAGEDVIYSGTIAGAMEGTVLGIPPVSLSQAYKSRSGQPPHWATSLPFPPDTIPPVLPAAIPRHS